MDGFAQFSQLHFLRPAWLLLVFPFAALALLQLRTGNPSRHWKTVIAAHLLPRMIIHGRHRRGVSPSNISIVLIPIIILALAGPSWNRTNTPFAEDKAPLIIAIDLSASMSESDLQPSRLQRARDKILQVVENRGDAYTALLAYSGSAHRVLPLSDDQQVLLHFLDALQVGMLPRRGKSPETVVPLAAELLQQGLPGGTLLLVGDGGSDTSAEAFSAFAKDRATQVLVWGMGKTQEQLDSDARRGLTSDAQPLQEKQLQAIAAAAEGYYRQASVDDADIRDLRRRIKRHYNTAEDSGRPWVDSGYWLLPPIMLLFLLWFRRGWMLQW
ncbi:MAG: VWA domain-containing protein [Congregibacter sp.]